MGPKKPDFIVDLELLHIFNPVYSHQCWEKTETKQTGPDLAYVACSAIYRCYFQLKPKIAIKKKKLLPSYIKKIKS